MYVYIYIYSTVQSLLHSEFQNGIISGYKRTTEMCLIGESSTPPLPTYSRCLRSFKWRVLEDSDIISECFGTDFSR